ncbi:uncharacterized protein LOC111018153 [Momordica charantia]|uniref:Uncharacterized protein LOC111018153 n=1 Tax=Momordica charantia TaxID=3673 RepID=A0A6J1D850_MOMCH|nr:uncharacterized protein LOC111018153 [Momordica charantia]
MTQEELEAYFRELMLASAITPIKDINRCFTEEIQHGAKEAIKDYNQKNNTNFEVVEIEKANVGGSCGIGLYITFKVKPSGTPAEYPTTTFQAQVLDCTAGYFIEVCRIKPSN